MEKEIRNLIVAARMECEDVVSLLEARHITSVQGDAECFQRAAAAVLDRLARNNLKITQIYDEDDIDETPRLPS